MRWSSTRAVAAAAAAAVAVLAGGQGAQASTAAPSDGGAITASFGGIPSHLAVGGSFTVTVTVRSNSPDRIITEGVYIGLWNTAQGGFEQTKGITVTFKDPTTGAWEPASSIESNGTWSYDYANPPTVAPHSTFTWEAHVSMNSAAKQGTEHIITNGIGDWSLETATGQPTDATLDYDFAQSTFGFGSGSSAGGSGSGSGSGTSGGGSGGSSGGSKQSSDQSSTSHATEPTHSAARPSPSAAPTHSRPSASPTPSASPSQAATSATLAPSPAPASSSPAAQLDASNTSDSTPLALWALGVVVVVGLAGGVFARRRVRRR